MTSTGQRTADKKTQKSRFGGTSPANHPRPNLDTVHPIVTSCKVPQRSFFLRFDSPEDGMRDFRVAPIALGISMALFRFVYHG